MTNEKIKAKNSSKSAVMAVAVGSGCTSS